MKLKLVVSIETPSTKSQEPRRQEANIRGTCGHHTDHHTHHTPHTTVVRLLLVKRRRNVINARRRRAVNCQLSTVKLSTLTSHILIFPVLCVSLAGRFCHSPLSLSLSLSPQKVKIYATDFMPRTHRLLPFFCPLAPFAPRRQHPSPSSSPPAAVHGHSRARNPIHSALPTALHWPASVSVGAPFCSALPSDSIRAFRISL